MPYFKLYLVYDTIDIIRFENFADETINYEQKNFIGTEQYKTRKAAQKAVSFIEKELLKQPTLFDRMQAAAEKYERMLHDE